MTVNERRVGQFNKWANCVNRVDGYNGNCTNSYSTVGGNGTIWTKVLSVGTTRTQMLNVATPNVGPMVNVDDSVDVANCTTTTNTECSNTEYGSKGGCLEDSGGINSAGVFGYVDLAYCTKNEVPNNHDTNADQCATR